MSHSVPHDSSSKHHGLTACAVALLLATLSTSCDDQYEISADELPHTAMARLTVITPDHSEIDRDWIDHTQFSITEATNQADTVGEMSIKGRGNMTWTYPKRPYNILLPAPCCLMGMDKGNTWALLANYQDKTLLRNDVALYMSSQMSLLDYTPDSRMVNLVVNNVYRGIYQLCELPESSLTHYNTDIVLLEFDAKAHYHDITFHTSHNTHPINIHYPEVSEGDATYHHITQWIQAAEDALFSENFTDSIQGYRRYFDVTSFAEWYILNEIAKSNDAIFYTSCFMHGPIGGKISMGPVWDFDMAFGNYQYKNKININNPEGFYIKNVEWYGRLFQDPAFVKLVKQRFNDYFTHRGMIYQHIDQMSNYLCMNISLENKLWGKLCDNSSPSIQVETEYTNQAEKLKTWIERRMQWLKQNIDNL
jgi:hypothetical protein